MIHRSTLAFKSSNVSVAEFEKYFVFMLLSLFLFIIPQEEALVDYYCSDPAGKFRRYT